MIQMKEVTLTSFLHDAKAIAMEKGKQQLISWTKKIYPLSIINAFKRMEPFNENRLFWSNSDRNFMLFGFGTVEEIVATDDRFEQLEQEWAQLVDGALVYNPYEEQGTGLTALGGMSFDPLRTRSELWENFPMSQLTVPKYLIVYEAEQYYLTINRYVGVDDDINTVIEQIDETKQMMRYTSSDQSAAKQKINEQIEKDPIGWKKSVKKAVESIQADEAQKIVLARELRLKLNNRVQVGSLVEKLMDTQEQSYIFAYEQGDDCFVGASPERLVQVQGNELLSTCLAGTAPRGENELEDEQIANDELIDNAKNREEHEHVVQMIHSSITPFCHGINIPENPVILTLRNLQHLYTPVTATLNDGVSVFNLIEVLHPTPALGGVPTDKALQFIREEEQFDRGWYGAPIGWLDANGNSEFAVAIRSGLAQKDEMSLFAGCGVMADSDPEQEYEETAVKFLPLLTILEDHE